MGRPPARPWINNLVGYEESLRHSEVFVSNTSDRAPWRLRSSPVKVDLRFHRLEPRLGCCLDVDNFVEFAGVLCRGPRDPRPSNAMSDFIRSVALRVVEP
jgi:hypothetical protein